jgi:hypothetical protein
MLCLSYYLLCFLFNKIGEQEGRTGSVWKWGRGWGEVAQTMYTHVSKCKNNKKKSLCFKDFFCLPSVFISSQNEQANSLRIAVRAADLSLYRPMITRIKPAEGPCGLHGNCNSTFK